VYRGHIVTDEINQNGDQREWRRQCTVELDQHLVKLVPMLFGTEVCVIVVITQPKYKVEESK
tara:strand:- start:215 stop:400 length:186 start_codon:yes stop_codon:yes gene_type:complete